MNKSEIYKTLGKAGQKDSASKIEGECLMESLWVGGSWVTLGPPGASLCSLNQPCAMTVAPDRARHMGGISKSLDV
jgi:hypothetical protein